MGGKEEEGGEGSVWKGGSHGVCFVGGCGFAGGVVGSEAWLAGLAGFSLV